ncbi:MAG: YceI family protein [Cyclobacteriaceae bacterium]
MKKLILTKTFMLGLVFATMAQTTWNIDGAHSVIGFNIDHMVVSEVEGRFNDFTGSLVASKDDLTDAKVNFTAQTASINTDNERRDDHLRSEDFFEAEKFPEITFTSSKFEKVSDGKYKMTGDLTMHGVTKTVSLDVKFSGTVDTGRGTKAGFKVSGVLNREDFGLMYNSVLEAGGVAIGKEVRLDIKLEMNKA